QLIEAIGDPRVVHARECARPCAFATTNGDFPTTASILPTMSALRSLVEAYLRAYNTRDLNAWVELFDEDAEVRTKIGLLHKRDKTREFALNVFETFPKMRTQLVRVVAENNDSIVVEYKLVNPCNSSDNWRLQN